jgi:DNA-binding NtrC family response regulator
MAGKVLIVEDEPVIAFDLEQILVSAGIEIVGNVGSVERALSVLQSTSCDAAVLDQSLKGESVENVASYLRKNGKPFIFVSGYGRHTVSTEYSDAPLLTKPVDPKQLVTIIEKFLAPK